MMRLVTFVAGTAFLVAVGAAMSLVADTPNLPSVWLYLALRVLFTAACVVTMSEDVARERLKPGPGAKPEPVYNAGAAISWIAHVVIVSLDLGRFHWSAGSPPVAVCRWGRPHARRHEPGRLGAAAQRVSLGAHPHPR